MRHPFDYETCVERLKKEYDKYGKLIVAFDFDNTIYDYHNNGGDYSEVIDLLQECADLHFELVLYTVEEEESKLAEKVLWLKAVGIPCDSNFYINHSSIFSHSRKPYYNILLDDRAGLEESYRILKQTVEYAKSKFN